MFNKSLPLVIAMYVINRSLCVIVTPRQLINKYFIYANRELVDAPLVQTFEKPPQSSLVAQNPVDIPRCAMLRKCPLADPFMYDSPESTIRNKNHVISNFHVT